MSPPTDELTQIPRAGDRGVVPPPPSYLGDGLDFAPGGGSTLPPRRTGIWPQGGTPLPKNRPSPRRDGRVSAGHARARFICLFV